MTVLNLLLLSFALGTDLFSVAIPIGMTHLSRWTIFRASLVFALFHIVMILTGYHLGHGLGTFVEEVGSQQVLGPQAVIQNWADLLGAVILVLIGVNMIRESFVKHKAASYSHPLQGWTLLMLATSVSIDAFAAGISMGMMDVDLIRLSILLGWVIFIISCTGLSVGRQLGRYVGAYAEVGGGALLTLFGLHLFMKGLF
ncbi:putative Mn2+ efflux pump MntP [Sporomusaceae bacterium BoRhaA]|nr:manganese efflux pump [Pelorhabdus rhamnosifermentans]MBU2702148.1 putative Mn2+ efflux pump MntP [Pelorhabdus rhamnosifermentans]